MGQMVPEEVEGRSMSGHHLLSVNGRGASGEPPREVARLALRDLTPHCLGMGHHRRPQM